MKKTTRKPHDKRLRRLERKFGKDYLSYPKDVREYIANGGTKIEEPAGEQLTFPYCNTGAK